MKWDFIKSRLTTNILLVLVVVVFGFAAFFFWFWSGLNYRFDSSVFNNIATPIAAILSVLLFGFLSFRQIKMMQFQNEIIQSQNLKPHFDKEIESIREILYKQVKLPIGEEGATYSDSQVTKVFYQIYTFLKTNEEYTNDLSDWNNGVRKHLGYFSKRIYYNEIFFLQFFHMHGIFSYNFIVDLIKHINGSKLSLDDKRLYIKSIKEEFLDGYFSFVDFVSVSPQEFMIPIVWFPMDSLNIEFAPFTSWGMREQYNTLKELLQAVPDK